MIDIEKLRQATTVVIPAKDEEGTIAKVIGQVSPYAGEIIVVDGHSVDATREIAARLGVKVVIDHGRGKGEAIRCALEHISNPITVFIDADGSHDASDIPRLAAPVFADEYDHVTGSRLIQRTARRF